LFVVTGHHGPLAGIEGDHLLPLDGVQFGAEGLDPVGPLLRLGFRSYLHGVS